MRNRIIIGIAIYAGLQIAGAVIANYIVKKQIKKLEMDFDEMKL